MGTLLIVSVPPAMPVSIIPVEIFAPMRAVADRLVPQAR